MSPKSEKCLEILGRAVEAEAQSARSRKRLASLRGRVSLNGNKWNTQRQLNFDLFLIALGRVWQCSQKVQCVPEMTDGFQVGGVCKRASTGFTPTADSQFIISCLAIMVGQNLRSIFDFITKMLFYYRGDIGVNLLSLAPE